MTTAVSMVNIGADVLSVKAAGVIIMQILNCKGADQSTKVAAIEALKQLCKVENTTISGCTFTTTQAKAKK